MKDITILAIESSCDETSASIVRNGKVLNNIVATQEVHQKYGGVIPELASRAHQQHIVPVVDQAMQEAGVKKEELSAIAFTRGPGLLGALLVGVSFAKSMALALDIPLIEVNHMQAHILAHFIGDRSPKFPFLCLTVSGGHTQIVLVKSHLEMEVIGKTLDDAVGEAFDKSAKLMGLPYPGGPLIDQFAKEGNPHAFAFPMGDIPALDYSFSGIKTAILYFLRDNLKKDPEFIEKNKADICASIQYTFIQILMRKLKRAAREYKINEIAVAGGVSANSGLRETLDQLSGELGWSVYFPDFQYCTDNAGMIAIAGHYKYLAKEFVGQDISPMPRMAL
ncbi:MAG: tRNA (adenosine(37)-N6)-threonylcarbamoyltransferase complex transferase subunit TsaD [Cytophagales bacterium]|nr:tRNA (adenosine(37)-N6)-threonylcarbamoyltransferase complex transferase subunit TsaD [Cytophagales bacterium]